MSKFHSYLHTASQIIQAYQGDVPLSTFLKSFFAQQKKFGSKDRKALSALCFQYYRVAHLLEGSVPFRICGGEFLCNETPSPFLEIHQPEWNNHIQCSWEDKLLLLQTSLEKLFPFQTLLSRQIDKQAFTASFLKQPDVFLRVRPGKMDAVLKKLQTFAVPFQREANDILRFPAAVKVSDVLKLNRDVVIQDMQSANVLEGLLPHIKDDRVKEVWDCCAASGGKSILLYDTLNGKMRLTVTDIRQQILQKLKERLQQARIPVQAAQVVDLTQPVQTIPTKFDIILCDAPCTGSGTWARTPEQLYFFNEASLKKYQQLQHQIVQHVWPHLKPGGWFVYITCSVFTSENEDIVSAISALPQAKLLHTQYHKGYGMQADTLFSAVFTKLL